MLYRGKRGRDFISVHLMSRGKRLVMKALSGSERRIERIIRKHSMEDEYHPCPQACSLARNACIMR